MKGWWRAVAVALALGSCRAETVAPQPRADLALLTSLPIVFGEQFGLEAPESSLLKALEAHFEVRPIDGPEELASGGLLLAVQPQALTAERLVALDAWVRAGGRMVLLADPRLQWESQRPLGDPLRPPYSYQDTGLLLHWGLHLEAGVGDVAGGRDVGGNIKVEARDMGKLIRRGRGCRLGREGLAARCSIGKGRVIIVADADFAVSGTADNEAAVVALVKEIAGTPR